MVADDPDLALVVALQSGDDQALTELMRRHEGALFRFLYRNVLNAADAADLTQETFVRAYFKIRQFRPGAKFSVWLYRIALNLARDHARSRAVRQAARTFVLPITASSGPQKEFAGMTDPTEPSPSEALETKEDVRVLEAAVDSLPHDLKQVFILAVLEGHAQKDCGEILGISPKTVETRVYRARKILITKLQSRFS